MDRLLGKVLYILDSRALSCLSPDEAIRGKSQPKAIRCLVLEEDSPSAVLSRVKLAMSISSYNKSENLSSSRERFGDVDYSRSMRDLHTHTARHILESSGKLDVVCLTWCLRQHDYN